MVAVERVVLVGEVRDKNAGISGVQIIAHRDSHASLLRAISIHCRAGLHAYISEREIFVGAVKIVGHGIVGDVNILGAALIKIRPGHA